MQKLCESVEGFVNKDWTTDRPLEHLQKLNLKNCITLFNFLPKRDEKHYVLVRRLLHVFVTGITYVLPLCGS